MVVMYRFKFHQMKAPLSIGTLTLRDTCFSSLKQQFRNRCIWNEAGGYGAELCFQKCFSYIVAVGFIGGGNWNTRRKPPTCHKSLTNFITW